MNEEKKEVMKLTKSEVRTLCDTLWKGINHRENEMKEPNNSPERFDALFSQNLLANKIYNQLSKGEGLILKCDIS